MLTYKPYTNSTTLDAFSKIVQAEGMLGLYKGIVPALFLTSHGAIQFASYEFMKSCAKALSPSDTQVDTMLCDQREAFNNDL
jgi:solute carrier family 25 folate transporter 32